MDVTKVERKGLRETLRSMEKGTKQLLELKSPAQIESARVTAYQLGARGDGRWTTKIVSKGLIEVERLA